MKGTSLVVTVILFLAIAVLYVLHFTGKGPSNGTGNEGEEVSGQSGLRIAYIKADSLIVNYDLAQALPHADRMVVMEAGRVALSGALAEVFDRMLSEQVYDLAVPALRRLKAALENETRKFSAWTSADEAAAEINACLLPMRRLSLSA